MSFRTVVRPSARVVDSATCWHTMAGPNGDGPSPYFRLDRYERLASELDPDHGPEAVKRMYTTWVEPSGVRRTLDDYAHRQLSGLMGYYYGRWTQFFASEAARSPSGT